MFFEPPLLASAPPIEIPASEQLYTILFAIVTLSVYLF